MTDDIVARARAALEGVTCGPWTVVSGAWGNVWHFPEGDHNDGRPTVVVRMGGMTEADSTFIAASRSLVPELLAEVELLREEAEGYHNLIGRQGDLLTATVNALRGEPPELTTWSHHDVAELAAGLMSERARDRAEVERLRGALDRLANELEAADADCTDTGMEAYHWTARRLRYVLAGGQ